MYIVYSGEGAIIAWLKNYSKIIELYVTLSFDIVAAV